MRVAKDSAQDAVAVRAAVAVFESFGRLSERSNLEERIAKLEAALAVHQRRGPVIPMPPERKHG